MDIDRSILSFDVSIYKSGNHLINADILAKFCTTWNKNKKEKLVNVDFELFKRVFL